MTPLKTNQQVLTWLCVYPAHEATSKWKKRSYVALTILTIITMMSTVLASLLYFLKFVSIDLERSLYPVFQICGAFSLSYDFLIMLYSKHKLIAIITKLSAIYRANENDASFRFVAQANNRSEWMWQIYFKCLIGSRFLELGSVSVSVLFCYFMHGQFNVDYLYRPIRIISPWDERTPGGYFGDVCFFTIGALTYLLANGALLLLFISICLHHRAFYKMFRHSVRKLNVPDTNRNDAELLCQLVRFRISVKDWFLESAETFSPYILMQLISNVLFLACVVFQLDFQLKHISFSITILINGTAISLSNLFIYCFFGKLATESFEKMADTLYESDWRKLPVRSQKYVIFMMVNMQRPIYYHGFGMIYLKLETFCSLLRAVFTYYMMFKTLTAE